MPKQVITLIIFTGLLMSLGCVNKPNGASDKALPEIAVHPENFDTTIHGKKVKLYTLQNDNGMMVQVSNYGAIIVSIIMPDDKGNHYDFAMGYDNIHDYLHDPYHFGCIIGRYANRIGKGQFVIDGKKYQLPLNAEKHSIHSGPDHFGTKVWDANKSDDTLSLHYRAGHMENGLPGNLDVSLKYVLTENNELETIYTASTDKKTLVNLTNHTFLNMKGEGNGRILDHRVKIKADKFVEIDSTKISTGYLMPVAGTPFDLREEIAVRKGLFEDHEQLKFNNGYGHCWVLSEDKNEKPVYAATVKSPGSGFMVSFYTTEPGMQFYTGNHFDGDVKGKSGKVYVQFGGLTLEPEIFPDAPNHDNFPSAILNPNETYFHKTVMAFEHRESLRSHQ